MRETTKRRRRGTTVGCGCGWRGRRVQGDCACYDEWAMACSCAWGRCPKCNGRVTTVATLVLYRRLDKQLAAPASSLPSPERAR